MTVSSILAFYDMATVMAVKGYKVQPPAQFANSQSSLSLPIDEM
jgi:hypothetical protein